MQEPTYELVTDGEVEYVPEYLGYKVRINGAYYFIEKNLSNIKPLSQDG